MSLLSSSYWYSVGCTILAKLPSISKLQRYPLLCLAWYDTLSTLPQGEWRESRGLVGLQHPLGKPGAIGAQPIGCCANVKSQRILRCSESCWNKHWSSSLSPTLQFRIYRFISNSHRITLCNQNPPELTFALLSALSCFAVGRSFDPHFNVTVQ